MDDAKIENNEDLIEYIEKNKSAGDRTKLKFIRKDKEYETTTVLKDLDDL